ncbi:hypothetical protein ACQJBY_024097 [Aegilops geniculata]
MSTKCPYPTSLCPHHDPTPPPPACQPYVSVSDASELALAMPTMCSTECPGEENSATRTTPTPTAAPLSSSTSDVPATCGVSTEVRSMALKDISSSSPTPTELTTTQELSPPKFSIEGLNCKTRVAWLKYFISPQHLLRQDAWLTEFKLN